GRRAGKPIRGGAGAHDSARGHERRSPAQSLSRDRRSACRRPSRRRRDARAGRREAGMMKIGLLCGREYSFPPAFVDRVNARGAGHGIVAELARLGGTLMNEPPEYRVIVDRISHEVDYYRGYLKHAALQGTYVINNPFWWTADDKFFNYAVAAKLGVAIPKTILLPQKSYPSDVDIVSESLRNLKYP